MVFQLIATGILLAFYGCYYGKVLQQKQAGIQTDQIGKGKVGFVLFIEITMKIFAILTFATEVTSIFYKFNSSPVPIRILGIVISILGVTAFISAVLSMHNNWRAGVSKTDKTKLVTAGIYQISRNPAFLGFDLLYIGILLMFFNWILFLVSCFAIIMYHLQIVYVEEDFLIATFGNEYLQYKKKVCRYIGRK